MNDTTHSVTLLQTPTDIFSNLLDDPSIVASDDGTRSGHEVNVFPVRRVQGHGAGPHEDVVVAQARHRRIMDEFGLTRALHLDCFLRGHLVGACWYNAEREGYGGASGLYRSSDVTSSWGPSQL